MVSSVTLTIGIPTYNGSAYIRNALDSVISQIKGELGTRVDILVSDNASSDDIPEIIRTYQNTHPEVRIQYSRNEVNLGYDRNVDLLFKKASGQYVWMLADDDALKDGALLQIVNLLDRNPSLKAILVNFDQYDRKLEKILDRVVMSEEIYCRNPDVFLRSAKERYNLVSSLIINKDAWNEEDLSCGLGSNFIHVYALFKILLRGDSYIVPQPLVNMRMGSGLWSASGDSLLLILLDSGSLICSMKEMGYSAEIIRWLLKDARRYTYSTIPNAKLLGIKNKWGLIRKLITVYNSPSLWLKYLPIILCPDSIFKRLYPLKKRISSKTRIIERKLKMILKKSK